MCRRNQIPPQANVAGKNVLKRKHSLLLSTKSFDSSNNGGDGLPPTMLSTIGTLVFLVGCLCVSESMARFFLKDKHELLRDEANYKILARHLGVDFVSCATVVYLGLVNRHVCAELTQHFFAGWIGSTKKVATMAPAGYERRLFTYEPAAHQILLVFLAYQVKNLYDSYVWDDGLEFIMHHILAGMVAWSAMYPGYAHFYGIFFMGVSEISTGLLTLLANFDDEFGVPGLGEAFPLVKIALGGIFTVAFIVCRAIVWPYVSYHFVKDARAALKSDSPRTRGRRTYLKIAMFCLSGLSVLQVAWLWQIYVLGKEELAKLGF